MLAAAERPGLAFQPGRCCSSVMLKTIVALLGACLVMPALAASPEHVMVSCGDARLEVLVQGARPS